MDPLDRPAQKVHLEMLARVEIGDCQDLQDQRAVPEKKVILDLEDQ